MNTTVVGASDPACASRSARSRTSVSRERHAASLVVTLAGRVPANFATAARTAGKPEPNPNCTVSRGDGERDPVSGSELTQHLIETLADRALGANLQGIVLDQDEEIPPSAARI